MSEKRAAGPSYYLVLAAFTAAAFAAGWVLRGRSEVRLNDEVLLREDIARAAACTDVLRALDAGNTDKAADLTRTRLVQAIASAEAAVSSGARLTAELDVEEAKRALGNVVGYAESHLEPQVVEQAKSIRKALRAE